MSPSSETQKRLFIFFKKKKATFFFKMQKCISQHDHKLSEFRSIRSIHEMKCSVRALGPMKIGRLLNFGPYIWLKVLIFVFEKSVLIVRVTTNVYSYEMRCVFYSRHLLINLSQLNVVYRNPEGDASVLA